MYTDSALCTFHFLVASFCVLYHTFKLLWVQYLAIREFEYDIQSFVDFYTEESPNKPVITGVLVYIGSPDVSKNPYYLGPAPLQDMANQIATARGPAGPNYEYLFRLEESLYEIGKSSLCQAGLSRFC